jgi:hypothetical protein
MTQFGQSAHLTWLRAKADNEALRVQLEPLLKLLGISDEGLVASLAEEPFNNGDLRQLRIWNSRLAADKKRDRIGDAASRFFAAQALVAIVMRESALDLSKRHSKPLVTALEEGADGLLEVGKEQFDALGRLANEVVDCVARSGFQKVAIIECPLGNSLPVQAICDLAQERGITIRPEIWNPPRNTQRSHGRTVKDAATEFAKQVDDVELVIYPDDVITASRLSKLFDALEGSLGNRLLPVAMMFTDTTRQVDEARRDRLLSKLEKHASDAKLPFFKFDFPPLRIFTDNSGHQVRWPFPVIWGESDMVAGRRKVNLIFTLLDHLEIVLKDLAADESIFRPFLIRSWSRDMQGLTIPINPNRLQHEISELLGRLDLDDLVAKIQSGAIAEFPDDYCGRITERSAIDPQRRYDWLRRCFMQEAAPRIGADSARFLWRAFDASIAASFPDVVPESRPDKDYAPYTLPFNEAIGSFNRRLRGRLVEQILNAKAKKSGSG